MARIVVLKKGSRCFEKGNYPIPGKWTTAPRDLRVTVTEEFSEVEKLNTKGTCNFGIAGEIAFNIRDTRDV